MNVFRLYLFWSIFLPATMMAQSSISLSIRNIHASEGGDIYIGIYQDEKVFPDKGKPHLVKVLPVVSSTMEISIDELAPGIYALSVFHDTNKNKSLDKTFFGLPKEGYGFSRNHKPIFRPPRFSDASFRLSANEKKKLHIALIY